MSENLNIDFEKCRLGFGNANAKVMVVLDRPEFNVIGDQAQLAGSGGALVYKMLEMVGIPKKDVYFTYAIKYRTRGKNVPIKEIKYWAPHLQKEIENVKPEIIVVMGRVALDTLRDGHSKMLFSNFRGTITDYPAQPDIKVITTFSPAAVLLVPNNQCEFNQDWEMVARLYRTGTELRREIAVVRITTLEELEIVVNALLSMTPITLAIDLEWEGEHWQDPNGYIRTIQFSPDMGMGIVVELFDEEQNPVVPKKEALVLVKELFENRSVEIVGHNVRADGEWLLSRGINIRKNVVYDTMLAEHLLNPLGPFGLNALTIKYTDIGRYDQSLREWEQEGGDTKTGYGAIPSDILIPYAATDVVATFEVMNTQLPKMEEFMERRGNYPSLLESVMIAQDTLYEVEMGGLKVDMERLESLTKQYQDKLMELELKLKLATEQLGMPNFNFKSPKQVSELLFNKLNIPPVKTTEGKRWAWIMSQDAEITGDIRPSTDKVSLEILQDRHPLIKAIKNIRKVEHVCKTWLRDEEDALETGGGLFGKIWPDGKIHSRFSQLKETGRFSSKQPNIQNFPQRSEGEIAAIFNGPGEEVPPPVKTVFIPEEGHVFMEADWKQAELFVLAYLSGDEHMKKILTTPGMDMHDMTTFKAFNVRMEHPEGGVVTEDDLVEIAAVNFKAYKDLRDSLIYIDNKGFRMRRDTFDLLRVAGKTVNFGICYGRGAEAIALQIKAETGTPKSLADLTEEAQKTLDAWKHVLYPGAWRYLMECNQAVSNPGYLINPWGRKRHFPPTTDKRLLASMGREAQNANIQSTVADTCMVAFGLINAYRDKYNMKTTIVNQIHDAILFQVPEEEIEIAKQMAEETMGNIIIPIPDAPLTLKVDIEIMSRWGETID